MTTQLELCDVAVVVDGIRFCTRQGDARHHFAILDEDLRAIDVALREPFDARASLTRCWPRIARAAQMLIDAGVSGEPLIVTSRLVEQASPARGS